MIITTTRHGRTKRDTQNLVAHLNKGIGQTACIVGIGGVALSNADDVVRYMEMMRDGSKATVAMHHITLSPSVEIDEVERDRMVVSVLEGMDASDHAWILWEHRKPRAELGGSGTHWHLVVGHVGPDGRALDDGHSYARLETVARALETDWGHEITPSRRGVSVAAALDESRPDVAVAVRMTMSPELPRSATTSAARASAARRGLDLPVVQAAVRAAWTASKTPGALRAALATKRLAVAPGRRTDVWVVHADDVLVGALDRIVRVPRARVAVYMQQSFDVVRHTVEHVRDQLDVLRRSAEDRLQQAVIAPLEPEELMNARIAARAAKKATEEAFYGNLHRERKAAYVLREPRPTAVWGLPSRRAEEWDRAAAVLDEIQAARQTAHEARARVDQELARSERAVASTMALERDRRHRQGARARDELLVLAAAEACLEERPSLARKGAAFVLREARRRLDRPLYLGSPDLLPASESVPSGLVR